MLLTTIPFWKEAPFVRLLLPFSMGIVLQWYWPSPLFFIIPGLVIAWLCLVFMRFTRDIWQYKFSGVRGICLQLSFLGLGMLLTEENNIHHQPRWFGQFYNDTANILMVIKQPLVEKKQSYKTEAEVILMQSGESVYQTEGRILLYFRKESSVGKPVKPGDVIITNKSLQPIRNSGNPGMFDYQQYCLFRGISHQLFLDSTGWMITDTGHIGFWQQSLQRMQHKILSIVKRYVQDKRQQGIAEALLIGYREDIDRDLVQEYADTGVIHVIAISGMHLAMIYGLLLMLLKRIGNSRRALFVKSIIILLVLWSFSFLTGAGPSILRSAFMFSFIVVGQNLNRPVSVYHSLAASAFFMLCYDPFLLWDVGFQLSYAAVLSIVLFSKAITNWVFLKNKLLNAGWQVIAVTIAAQMLTTPIAIFHFHQQPNLFLVSNLFIVPLSGIILYGEILLCLISGVEAVAVLVGQLVGVLIGWMNAFNSWLSHLPFAVTRGIYSTLPETILMYGVLLGLMAWFSKKRLSGLKWALLSGLFWVCLNSVQVIKRRAAAGIIVYNVPKRTAMDFYEATNCAFEGDSSVLQDDFLRRFHLEPARLQRGTKPGRVQGLFKSGSFIFFRGKRIVVPDSATLSAAVLVPMQVDLIVLSDQVKASVIDIQSIFQAKQYVFDSSCPRWKMHRWKIECDRLHLRRHSVLEDGAYIMDL